MYSPGSEITPTRTCCKLLQFNQVRLDLFTRYQEPMRRITLLLAVLFSVGCNNSEQNSVRDNEIIHTTILPSDVPSRYGGGGFCSYPQGKSVAVTMWPLRGPVWENDSANPPLTAIEAINAGLRKQRELFPDNDRQTWQLTGAKLTPWDASKGYWYWELTFDWKPVLGNRSGIVDELRLAVLMDGTVVEPDIKDYE